MSNLLLPKSSVIHIPKCAGTFLQAFLFALKLPKYRYSAPQDGHLFLHQMTQSKDTYNFTFVRHPYTWWPSFYEWSKNTRFSESERQCPDFDTWIQDYGPFWMGLYTQLVKRYIGEDPVYVSDVKMHFIGKTENIFEDLHTALINAGESFEEHRFQHLVTNHQTNESLVKWSNKQTYSREISDASKAIIYQTERYVFDKFDYTK
jgi:hypothetical protein